MRQQSWLHDASGFLLLLLRWNIQMYIIVKYILFFTLGKVPPGLTKQAAADTRCLLHLIQDSNSVLFPETSTTQDAAETHRLALQTGSVCYSAVHDTSKYDVQYELFYKNHSVSEF